LVVELAAEMVDFLETGGELGLDLPFEYLVHLAVLDAVFLPFDHLGLLLKRNLIDLWLCLVGLVG